MGNLIDSLSVIEALSPRVCENHLCSWLLPQKVEWTDRRQQCSPCETRLVTARRWSQQVITETDTSPCAAAPPPPPQYLSHHCSFRTSRPHCALHCPPSAAILLRHVRGRCGLRGLYSGDPAEHLLPCTWRNAHSSTKTRAG